MKQLVLASNNKHKITEFETILAQYQILTLDDIGFQEEIVEDGETLLENAFIKAKSVHNFLLDNNLSYDVISDDTGLFVPSLNGEPGIHSARYAGNHDDKSNRNKLRENVKDKDRDAYFMCQIVYYPMNGDIYECNGKVEGLILDEERGKDDFGYDCIFFSKELEKTFGEASKEEKNRVSHRGRAIQKLKDFLEKKA